MATKRTKRTIESEYARGNRQAYDVYLSAKAEPGGWWMKYLVAELRVARLLAESPYKTTIEKAYHRGFAEYLGSVGY